MVEELGGTLEKGFETWKKNLSICLPFVLSAVVTGIVAMIIIGGAILAAIPSLVPHFTKLEELTYDEIPQVLPQLLQSMGILIIAIIVTIILGMLIDAFFWAGAIGMAKEAIETGHTDLSHMMDYGKRKFLSLFFTNLIIGLLSFVGVIFLVPGMLYLLPRLSAFSELPEGEVITAAALFGLGFLALIVSIMLIGIVFALPRYAVVIDDVGAISGIKKGFKIFMDNKLAIFLLWLIIFALTLLSMSFGVIQYIGGVIVWILSLIVISPLTVIWWSRLYLSVVEPVETSVES